MNWLDRENPQAGGAEEHLHQIFGRLVSRGHEVTVLCSGWQGSAPRAEADGLSIHRSGSRYTFNLTAPPYFRRHLLSEGHDLLIEDLNKVPVFTTKWPGSAKRVLLVHHLFGATAFQEANPVLASATWLMERAIPWLYRGVPTIAVSESTKEDLIGRGLEEASIEVIQNGVDTVAFQPGSDRSPRPSLVYVGRLKRYKRIDLILQAIARLAERGIHIEAVIAGRGDHGPHLISLAEKLEITDRVSFAGFVSEETKLSLLQRSWVHVLTSPKEGWGITALEAAAAGTATVASDSPGLRESVQAERTGLLVPHGDVEALADALVRMMNVSERDRLGTGARSYAESLSWDAVTDRMERSLRRIAGS